MTGGEPAELERFRSTFLPKVFFGLLAIWMVVYFAIASRLFRFSEEK